MVSPRRAIDEFLGRLENKGRLAVALSGGSDSTALAWLLGEAVKSGRLESLLAITIDHGLRQESASEVEQVARMCGQLGITHDSAMWTGPKPVTGIQNAARLARYRLLRNIARRHGVTTVVTAHTLDDQIETVEMRAGRAAGSGLSGMAETMLYARDLWIVRPLLKVRRGDLRAVLEQAGLGWIEDPGNRDRRFERVRIREQLAARASGAVIANIENQGEERRRRARDLAVFLDRHVRIHGCMVAQLSPSECSDDPQFADALALLAAILGGKNYLPAAAVRERLAGFVRNPQVRRRTASGCILEFRERQLYIYRERRNIPELKISPGNSVIWDGRFRVVNPSRDVSIVAGTARPGHLDDVNIAFPDVPAAIARRAAATAPVCHNADDPDIAADCRTSHFIALYDLFLPEFDWIVAQRYATLAGLRPYPERPLGPSAREAVDAG